MPSNLASMPSFRLNSLSPYIPDADMPWNDQRVRHIYDRFGYGANLSEIQQGLSSNPSDLVDQLVDGVLNAPALTPPYWANYSRDDYDALNDDDIYFEHKAEMRRIWIAQKIDDPFRAKLALFWHNHFVTEEDVYDCNSYMWSYYELLNNYALGNFRRFVEEMGKNAAMLVYLNGNENVAEEPNENYARELMELFTMGENNGYTQTDVEEVSRALTGWRTDRFDCTPPYFESQFFDSTNKTIFGQTDNWNYDDVHELIFTLRKDQVATFICSKLYRFLVYDQVVEEVLAEMKALFESSGWLLAQVVRELLKSRHFFESRFITARIRTPF